MALDRYGHMFEGARRQAAETMDPLASSTDRALRTQSSLNVVVFLLGTTRDTGTLACKLGGGVHFGVNELGLHKVVAKDIAMLPDWRQQIWSSFNVPPSGGVSQELMTL